jgi:predicted enzyme related to lactoylglutathione lyase
VTTKEKPIMFKTVLTVVDDLDAAKAAWSALLGDPTSDAPYYVGWTLDDHEIGLTPAQDPADRGTVSYWHTDDIEGAMARVAAAGGSRVKEPQDVGGGRLVAVVADAEGNRIGLIQDA